MTVYVFNFKKTSVVEHTTEENTVRSASTKMTKPVETKPRDKAITYRGLEPLATIKSYDKTCSLYLVSEE